MGKLNKHANLYDKDGDLLRTAPLKNYSIRELEELLDSWPEGPEYVKAKYYATSLLTQMYLHPDTEEDKEYVTKVQKELIQQLTQNKSSSEEAIEKLEEVNNDFGEINTTSKDSGEAA